MPGVLDNISAPLQKQYHLDDKPYMRQVTVEDLKNLNKALVHSMPSGQGACNTCCCCCAAAITPVV